MNLIRKINLGNSGFKFTFQKFYQSISNYSFIKKHFSTSTSNVTKVALNNPYYKEVDGVIIPNISLNTISDNYRAKIKKIQVGRGPGSKLGKTSGRGHKGKQHGYSPPIHIEGGQTRLARKTPKFGKVVKREYLYTEFNINQLHYLIVKGRLDPSKQITIKEICRAGGVSKLNNGIKLLGKGLEKLKELPPLNIIVTSASKDVIQKINELGGTISCHYTTKRLLRFMVKPYLFKRQLRGDIYPRHYDVKRLLKLEKNGAKLIYNKPGWMFCSHYNNVLEKIKTLKDLLDKQINANLLPKYPASREKGVNNKKKIPKTVKGTKVILDKSAIKKK